MPDPYAVLGVPPNASLQDLREARRALAKALHPDLHRDPAAERRLAEVNAAYDELMVNRPPSEREPAFTIAAFRPAAFEALLVAAADVGDVTDTDEPFSLEIRGEGGFCRLELFPEAGGTLVSAGSDQVDARQVCEILVEALRGLGVTAGCVR